MKKSVFRSIGFAIAALATSAALAGPTNVVVIMPDDLSFGDYSFYNQDPKSPQTPNVDRLGSESVRLADFHVAPTCSPSRAQLLTGRYANTTGVWHTVMGRYFLRADEVTMADVFKTNGYRTALFGKWHLGESYPFRPQDRGFEYTAIHLGGGTGQQPDYWGNRNTAPSTYFVNGKPVPLNDETGGLPSSPADPEGSGPFATNFFTTQALDYMKARQERQEPFFAFLAYNAAHGPHNMPPDARDGASARTATIENFDKNVGRVLKFIDESGMRDDTLVVMILGDNGMGSKVLRGGKGSEYEGGHRVPCFVRWPAGGYAGTQASAREIAAMTSQIDLLPTLIDVLKLNDVANRPADVAMDGHSLKTVLDADPSNDDPALATRVLVVDNQREDSLVKYKQVSVMRDEVDSTGNIAHKWRLIRSAEAKPWELYDVQADPLQQTNLLEASQQAPKEIVQSLQAAYDKWWSEVAAHSAEYARPVLGSSAEPIVCLYSHDWHMSEGLPPWNQGQIAGGAKGNGVSAVSFAKDGRYTFDLRRWPKEIADQTTLTSKAKTSVLDEKGKGETVESTALPIRSARIRVWTDGVVHADERQNVDPNADGAIFTVKVPAGPASVQTWFYDADGNELVGAYYVYAGAEEAVDAATNPTTAGK